LLKQGLVEPGQLEIFVMNADGSGQRLVTTNGTSNFSPFYFPDGKRIIFSSNIETKGEGGRPSFHLYVIGEDGQGLERLTFDGQFNSFHVLRMVPAYLGIDASQGARRVQCLSLTGFPKAVHR
jgi:Tol biopolymer transport system component